MKDIKKIQEFFSKPLEENTFKKGDKVTYLGNPAEITFVGKDQMDRTYYSVSYDKGNGKTKASNLYNKGGEIKPLKEGTFDEGEIAIYMGNDDSGLTHIFKRGSGYYGYNDEFDFEAKDKAELEAKLKRWGYELQAGSLEEMDINDPVLMKMRADKDKLAKMRAANAGDDGNDHIFRKARENVKKLEALKQKRAQIMRDMEQEAEPEGGPIADKYGAMLNKIDKAIDLLSPQKKGDEYMSKDEIERRASMISDPYADYTSKTNAMFGLEEDKPVANPNKHIKGIQIQLDQLGVKYEMDPKNKVQPFKVIYKPVNKDDDFYDKFDDIVFRYNLKGVVKTSMSEAKEEDAVDTITMDIPLFIRMLEYSREDAAADVDLHDVTEKANKLGKEKGILSMEDYEEIVGAAEDTPKGEVDEAELTEAYVPQNIKEFAKRKGVSRLVNTVAGWAEKVGARITGGTAIGKYYDTLILDMGYQTSDIRINCDDETVELYYEPVNSFADFKRVFMEEESRKQAEHDEETLRREQGLEEVVSKVVARIKEDRPGLWANIHAQRERGEKPARKGSKDYKAAVKAGKEINKKK